jgi:hypothetical protein
VADEIVGRFNPAAAHRIAALAGETVVQAFLMPLEIAKEVGDLCSGLAIGRFHPLQVPDDPMPFSIKQPGQGGLAPFALSLPRRPVLQRRDLVEMLATMVVVQNFHGGHPPRGSTRPFSLV